MEYRVVHLPISKIFADPSFNCRGHIQAIDVLDLAKDIQARGLDQPITVQPYTGKPGYEFRVVAGHRRHMAFLINKADTIPCYIRDDLDELKARTYNLRENLHRKDLNIVQEANALKYFLDYKRHEGSEHSLFTLKELADLFGQSVGWVQARKDLLKLPKEIQNEAAAGMLTQDQVKHLAKLKDPKDQYEFTRKIKEIKQRGDKVKLGKSVKRPSDALKAKARSRTEIQEMNDMLYDMLGPTVVSRAFAWCNGHISTLQLMESVKEFADENGLHYKAPDFINEALAGIKGDKNLLTLLS